MAANPEVKVEMSQEMSSLNLRLLSIPDRIRFKGPKDPKDPGKTPYNPMTFWVMLRRPSIHPDFSGGETWILRVLFHLLVGFIGFLSSWWFQSP